MSIEPRGDWYPFVAPPAAIRGQVFDLHLELDDPGAVVPPLRLVELSGLNLPEARLVVADSTGRVVLDTAEGAEVVAAEPFGPDRILQHWQAPRWSAWVWAADPNYRTPPVSWGSPVLDARCYAGRPRHLHALRAGAEDFEPLDTAPVLTLVPGHNATWTAREIPDGVRVTLDLGAGGGLGPISRCEAPAADADAIRTINGVGPDAGGNFTLGAAGCHWAGDAAGGGLQLGGDCHACCDCPDHLRAKVALDAEYARWQAAADRLLVAQGALARAVECWGRLKACRDRLSADVALRVNTPSTVDITARLHNPSATLPLESATLSVAFSAELAVAWSIVADSVYATLSDGTRARVAPAEDGGVLTFDWPDPIPPDKSVTAWLRIEIFYPTAGELVEAVVTAAGTLGDEAVAYGPTRGRVPLLHEEETIGGELI